MLKAVNQIIFVQYFVLTILFFLIGTNFLFAQSEEVHPFSLFDDNNIHPNFIDPFKKYRTAYLYKGEKNSVGILLKIDNKLRKYKILL